MDVDLRLNKPGGTWTRRIGAHEDAGVEVSIGDGSAHVTLGDLGIMFAIDRCDAPTAWETPIDIRKLRAEVVAALGKHMSMAVLTALISAIGEQRKRAYRHGERDAQAKIRKALGL